MSLTKSTFRLAAGGNFETSTSAALAPRQANKPPNTNCASRRVLRLIHLRRAERILTKLNISIGVRLPSEWLDDWFRRPRTSAHSVPNLDKLSRSPKTNK